MKQNYENTLLDSFWPSQQDNPAYEIKDFSAKSILGTRFNLECLPKDTIITFIYSKLYGGYIITRNFMQYVYLKVNCKLVSQPSEDDDGTQKW